MTALATFFLLAGKRLETGLPFGLLCAMAIVAGGFVCYDMVAVLRRFAPSTALRTIAGLNWGYCVRLIAILYIYRDSVTKLGFTYFGAEIAIVASLAYWEWIVASRSVESQ